LLGTGHCCELCFVMVIEISIMNARMSRISREDRPSTLRRASLSDFEVHVYACTHCITAADDIQDAHMHEMRDYMQGKYERICTTIGLNCIN
jgi:hypothetical protein